MAEFEIADKQYRSGRMNAFQQFHVARKLGPMLSKLGPEVVQGNPDISLAAMLSPIVDALAAMPEADCDFVLHRCLSVVQRFQGGSSWAHVWNEPAKRLMFDDIDLSVMIQIAIQVLGDNLGNFIGAPVSTSPPQLSQESTTPENLSHFPTTKTG